VTVRHAPSFVSGGDDQQGAADHPDAAGQIELDAVDSKTSRNQIRYAPSFVPGNGAQGAEHRPYTTIADFLGWKETTTGYVLQGLALVELGPRRLTTP
jgi:hypothetical protein